MKNPNPYHNPNSNTNPKHQPQLQPKPSQPKLFTKKTNPINLNGETSNGYNSPNYLSFFNPPFQSYKSFFNSCQESYLQNWKSHQLGGHLFELGAIFT